MNAIALDCPDNTFDFVYASNLLHHLPDPETAIRECTVFSSGKACFGTLRHNPVINVYRRIATSVRTEDETPLDINIVSFGSPSFLELTIRFGWRLCGFCFYLVNRVDPNPGALLEENN